MDKLGNITLINDDCMNVICDLPDKCFDLAIVDPPYGIGECGSNNKSRSKLAMAKDYHHSQEMTKNLLPPITSIIYLEFLKIRLYGEQIILLKK